EPLYGPPSHVDQLLDEKDLNNEYKDDGKDSEFEDADEIEPFEFEEFEEGAAAKVKNPELAEGLAIAGLITAGASAAASAAYAAYKWLGGKKKAKKLFKEKPPPQPVAVPPLVPPPPTTTWIDPDVQVPPDLTPEQVLIQQNPILFSNQNPAAAAAAAAPPAAVVDPARRGHPGGGEGVRPDPSSLAHPSHVCDGNVIRGNVD